MHALVNVMGAGQRQRFKAMVIITVFRFSSNLISLYLR